MSDLAPRLLLAFEAIQGTETATSSAPVATLPEDGSDQDSWAKQIAAITALGNLEDDWD